jgi:DNA-binding transcriptional MerR regulator
MAASGGELTISEVAERTGVAEGSLRMWETRYGFPEPSRLPSGHRRYSEQDVERVRQVARDREGGLSMRAAIERAGRAAAAPEPSIFAGVRRRRPDLVPYLLPKRTLIGLSHAIEDE